ncbi:MAG TPA: ArsA-related P-loop ATPase [Solirubrobacteraceae bacterium]|nr:ArsA-related P-loop ATPase [Solirubrobacteraceae bacterium]
MASLLERKLIVVTGKGGAGKSTIAGALGLLGTRRGLRTIVVEVGERSHLAALYGRENGDSLDRDGDAGVPALGAEIELEPGLWSLTLDPDAALIEWMRDLGGRLPARVLASSTSFRYFAAAAPGAKELVSLIKLHDLSAARDGSYDLVVLDAPATGHALAMLASPSTFTAIVRGGPLARRASEVQQMVADAGFSGYVAVTRATEMSVTETIELDRGLHERVERDLDAVVVNGTIARRFSAAELERIDMLANRSAATVAVARAAHAAAERAHTQRRQLARLRGLSFTDDGRAAGVLSVPFAFTPFVDREALAKIATRLERQLMPSLSSNPSSARQSRRTRTDRSR